ncbi:FdhF/YdeP family oxidoreductase [Microbacterium sp. JZ31]|uniref:FdhF/YdeP family oxidoreductase n=1 Tax=Microbacterium sp. JZ31 TaxID=1906274 RepID=UPI001EE3D1EF|nr:FdhF/YdeP family oxidoreductase [Microbacterium sp. JZ31]
MPAVMNALKMSFEQMGVVRSARTLLRVNQKSGFDCPGCAWPEEDRRHAAEFCENGAKAVAEEATLRRVGPAFFAHHSVAELREHDDYWLGQQGRLTTPMLLEEGETHYRPISWDAALGEIATALRELDDPNDAVFYTSGRTSNEAAFVYQLLVRGLGTNNLPDCSNMCHESSGSALNQTIGIGKGTVSITDIHEADLLIVAGQNPGTNHPRMLSALEKAKDKGATIVAVNPLPEAGLLQFKNPQTPRGVLLGGTKLADDFVQIRLGGDQALFQAIGKHLIEAEARDGGVLDHDFIAAHTAGFDDYAAHVASLPWEPLEEATGLPEARLREIGERVRTSTSTIVCWAMGLTQHKHSVPTLRDVVNVLLLQGNIGRPGAGVCPVRGHSNVQGDRTVGIYEKPAEPFLEALDREFAFTAPRAHGYDTVEAIRAMRDGRVRVFMAVGGNFVSATPDTRVVEEGMSRVGLTVQVSTKLNRSHVVHGRRAIILPTLGRTDRDRRGGADQRVTVEDSMGAVHGSRGRLAPPAEDLLSEVAILARLCALVFADRPGAPRADWQELENDYAAIRGHIAHVIPGFEDYDERIDKGRSFFLPNGPRDERRFTTANGKANFTANPLEYPVIPEGRVLLQTLRSHDQYNTTIYGKDDRYRGIHDGRRVVLIHRDDIRELGFAEGEMVDLVSEWRGPGGLEERRAEEFRLVPYDTPRRNAAAYYPETNVLVPLDSTADVSGTPTSKAVVVRLEKR